jgi:hypothetical protein
MNEEEIKSNIFDNLKIIKQEDSIKLSKMSKGYQWEIKLVGTDIERLKKLNKQMEEEYDTDR